MQPFFGVNNAMEDISQEPLPVIPPPLVFQKFAIIPRSGPFISPSPQLAPLAERLAEQVRQLLQITVSGDAPDPVLVWSDPELGLSHSLLCAICSRGYYLLAPLQAQLLPCLFSGRDCFTVAETGAGKTLTIVLAALQHIQGNDPDMWPADATLSCVLLSPRRERVLHIWTELERFQALPHGQSVPHGRTPLRLAAAAYGKPYPHKTDYPHQNVGEEGSRGVNIGGALVAVSTPPLLLDWLAFAARVELSSRLRLRAIATGEIRIRPPPTLKGVTLVVLDEVDAMLDMGMRPSVESVLSQVVRPRQLVIFSTTKTKEVNFRSQASFQSLSILLNPKHPSETEGFQRPAPPSPQYADGQKPRMKP